MARFKSVHDLKKESYLLVFMMNRMNSEGRLFTTCEDGWDFVKFGGTTNIKSLYSMLHNLKKKGYVKNKSHGVWDLTDPGFLEAKYWNKECAHQDGSATSAATNVVEEEKKPAKPSINALTEIAKQLRIANKLKALEMKAKNSVGALSSFVTPELLENILEDCD